MKTSRTLRVKQSPDRVLATLCCEAFNVEIERKRQGVVSTTFKSVSKTESLEVFEMRTVEYERTKLGRLDKSCTFESVTRSEFSAKNRTISWVYRGGTGMAKRIKLSGLYEVRPDGDGSYLSHDVEVVVDIPFIGGQIAKHIVGELEDTMPLIEAELRKHMVEG